MDELDTATLERKAAAVADMLRAIANERRLMILCKLVEWGEANVSALAEAVGLSQSALSQHLAKMRDEDLITFRREVADALVPDRRSAGRGAVCHPSPAVLPTRQQKQERVSKMTMRNVTPQEARRLIEDGAVLVDIREADEQARERIPGARHLPLSRLDDADVAAPKGRTVIFHCRSGARTKAQSARLAAKAGDGCRHC